jgi:hypothetical protein
MRDDIVDLVLLDQQDCHYTNNNKQVLFVMRKTTSKRTKTTRTVEKNRANETIQVVYDDLYMQTRQN